MKTYFYEDSYGFVKIDYPNVIERLRQISNEWDQEGNYCLTNLENEDRADVWFTVSEYLNNLADEIESERIF